MIHAASTWVKEKACAVFSILYWVNRYKNTSFSPSTIELYIQWMKEAGCFTDDMDVYWLRAFAFFGMHVIMVDAESDADFSIYNWYNKRTGFFHFTPGKEDICLNDSLGFSVTVHEGCIHSKRNFKILDKAGGNG